MQTDEQITSDYLLKIFRACIPHMPKTAAKFGQELQLALQPMILKPSSAGGVAVRHLLDSFAISLIILSVLRLCKKQLHVCAL
jgi:hypothetical protein